MSMNKQCGPETTIGSTITYDGKGGSDYDVRTADEVLERGRTYTVTDVIVGGWATRLQISGIEQYFNSCLFSKV